MRGGDHMSVEATKRIGPPQRCQLNQNGRTERMQRMPATGCEILMEPVRLGR